MSERTTRVDIIVPFYEEPHLADDVGANLLSRGPELAEIGARVLFFNDSPTNAQLTSKLQHWMQQLNRFCPTELIVNRENLGFVHTCNRGLEIARDSGSDALLLNSDALLGPGTVRELKRIAYIDPMIGFVNPRSNNATILSLPIDRANERISYEDACSAFGRLSPFLPEWHFIPTAVGFCIYIRNIILREVGLFDPIYSPGYNEENDLIMRANRLGFRCAAANRAFAYHTGTVSFQMDRKRPIEERNSRLLKERYPEYERAVQEYDRSPEFRFEKILSTKAHEKRKQTLALDLSNLQAAHNGTFECAKALIAQLYEQDEYALTVICSREAAQFHGIDRLFPDIPIEPADTQLRFDIAFRPSQPFEFKDVDRLADLATFNIYLILDSIAWDCFYLRAFTEGLDGLWRFVSRNADGIVFISQFSRDLFNRRFPEAVHTPQCTCLLSVNESDYVKALGLGRPETVRQASEKSGAPNRILIVGNQFYSHKAIRPTVDRLASHFPERQFIVLGSSESSFPNVDARPAGNFTAAQMADLYGSADVIIFPSFYEGFGFPLVHGLAHGKTVFVRESSLNAEVIELWNGGGEMVMYRDTDDLIERLSAIPASRDEQLCSQVRSASRGVASVWGWREIGEHLRRFLREVVKADTQYARCRKRFEELNTSNMVQNVPRLRARIEELENQVQIVQAAHDDAVGTRDYLSSVYYPLLGEVQTRDNLIHSLMTCPSFKIGKAITWTVKNIPGARYFYYGYKQLRGQAANR